MRASVVLLVGVAVIWSCAGVAAAHGDDGELRLVALQPTETDHEVEVVVDLAHDDGHAVYRGSVGLAGRSDAGASLLPATLDATAVDGRYITRVPLPPPGTWTLRISSQEPAAELEVVLDTDAPVYVDEAADPLPSASGHGVPWRWILLGMALVSFAAVVLARSGPPAQRRESAAEEA